MDVPNPLEISNEVDESNMLVLDRRIRKKGVTAGDKQPVGPMRRRLFIALHHFHPKVIDPAYFIARVQSNGTRYNLPDSVPVETVRFLGLQYLFLQVIFMTD